MNAQLAARLQPWGLFVVFVDCSLEPCVTLEGGSCGWGCSTCMPYSSFKFPLVSGGHFVNHIWPEIEKTFWHLLWTKNVAGRICFLPNEDFLLLDACSFVKFLKWGHRLWSNKGLASLGSTCLAVLVRVTAAEGKVGHGVQKMGCGPVHQWHSSKLNTHLCWESKTNGWSKQLEKVAGRPEADGFSEKLTKIWLLSVLRVVLWITGERGCVEWPSSVSSGFSTTFDWCCLALDRQDGGMGAHWE